MNAFKLCSKQHPGMTLLPNLMFMVKVQIQTEKLYLVCWHIGITAESLIQMLKTDMKRGIRQNVFIVYNNAVHHYRRKTNQLLEKAVINKTLPKSAPLLLTDETDKSKPTPLHKTCRHMLLNS
jgi:hypothetical protein